MKRVLFLLLLFFVSKGFSQNLFEAASDQYDVWISDLRLTNPTTVSYWDCPTAKVVESNPSVTINNIDNGWAGAHAVMSAILSYENTKTPKFYELFNPLEPNSWSDWLINSSQWVTCWGTARGGPNVTGEEICPWSDDTGWMINIYKLIYDYTNNNQFIDSSYKLLLDTDNKFGVNYGSGRFLIYDYGGDLFAKSYMVSNLLGALELFYHYRVSNPIRANECLQLAISYYNFLDEFMISDGTLIEICNSPDDVTTRTRTLPSGRVADEFRYNLTTNRDSLYCYWGFTGRANEVTNQQFTFVQMIMPVIYMMFENIQENLNVVIDNSINFKDLALNSANYAMDSCTEVISGGTELVFRNGVDPNVNGFAFYWWMKYIVPLNPDKYGNVVVNTAKAIIDNYGTNNIIRSCWNSPFIRTGGTGIGNCNCDGSLSKYVPTPSMDFRGEIKWHAAGASVVAAASAFEPMRNSYKEVLIPPTTNIPTLYMSATEITNAEYARIMNDNPYDYMFGILPITGITYYDAIMYCNARSKREGLDTVYSYPAEYMALSGGNYVLLGVVTTDAKKNGYRLPTLEEFKYIFESGNTHNASLIIDDYAVYDQSNPESVGSKTANDHGLYDMAGNVWEWVDYSTGSSGLLVGGAYNRSEVQLRGSGDLTGYTFDTIQRNKGTTSEYRGFRVVRKAPDITPAINLLLD